MKRTRRQAYNARLAALDRANRCAGCKVALGTTRYVSELDGPDYCSPECRDEAQEQSGRKEGGKRYGYY